MENVTITKTRTGNPIWFMDDLGFRIRIDMKERNGINSMQIRLNHKEIIAKDIRGMEVGNKHELYLTSVSEDNYETFCKDLVIMIRMLARQGLSNHEIGEIIFKEYNTRTKKKDSTDLSNKFKELSNEYEIRLDKLSSIMNELTSTLKEIDIIYKEMKDIMDSME